MWEQGEQGQWYPGGNKGNKVSGTRGEQGEQGEQGQWYPGGTRVIRSVVPGGNKGNKVSGTCCVLFES